MLLLGLISIRMHCVIGANSVVKYNIPDYYVAIGIPAGVSKKYNLTTGKYKQASL